MKRLTTRTEKGEALIMGDFYPNETAARADLMKRYMAAIERLAAYEDTGLEPEEIAALSQAEKDGRLMVLPCKVTDTVYLIESVLKGKKVTGEQVVSALIDHVTIGGTVGKPVFDICSATDNWYMALDPGEFFLTHEEAEAALAEKGIES